MKPQAEDDGPSKNIPLRLQSIPSSKILHSLPRSHLPATAMAENGPHGHQDSGAAGSGLRGGRAPPPPTTVAFSLTIGPYGNNRGSSSLASNMRTTMDAAAAGVGKQLTLIPDLNMEDHRDSAGGSKDKPRSVVEVVEIDDTDADADARADKGKSVVVASDDASSLQRERRKKKKDLFKALRDLMPHIPQKTDRVTVLGEAIKYMRALEENKAPMLGMQKLAQARQAAAAAAAARGESSSSFSFSLTARPAPPQATMAADAPPRVGGVPVAPAPAAPVVPAPAPAAAPSPVRYKTWSGQNFALTVANDNAYISLCAPRRPNTLTTVMSVLENYGISVVTAQISSDSVRTMFLIFANVTRINGANTSLEQVYQRAVSEIMLRLNSN